MALAAAITARIFFGTFAKKTYPLNLNFSNRKLQIFHVWIPPAFHSNHVEMKTTSKAAQKQNSVFRIETKQIKHFTGALCACGTPILWCADGGECSFYDDEQYIDIEDQAAFAADLDIARQFGD